MLAVVVLIDVFLMFLKHWSENNPGALTTNTHRNKCKKASTETLLYTQRSSPSKNSMSNPTIPVFEVEDPVYFSEDSDSEYEYDYEPTQKSSRDLIRMWSLKHNITHMALTDVLKGP